MRRHALTRRVVLGATAPLLLAPARSLAAPPQGFDLVHIGMNGTQIHAAWFDRFTGALTPLGPVAAGLRPTWTVQHPRLPVLYYTDEASAGRVVAFRVNGVTGALDAMGDMSAGGEGTTHLWLDAPSSRLIAANYGGGSVATLAIGSAGRLTSLEDVERSAGSGPHRRQAAPHPHSTVVDPSGRFVLAADLGADRVYVAPFDRNSGRLGPLDPEGDRNYRPPPGSGPRHLVFHRNGRIVYLINELTAEVHVLSWNRHAGRLALVQALSINDEGFAGQSSGGEIAVSHDGRFVYVSNRGDSSLVVHSVDHRTGRLTRIQKLSSGGDKPWHFTIHPGGQWMLVANRDANALRAFRISPRHGVLLDTRQSLATPMPLHVHFFGSTSLRYGLIKEAPTGDKSPLDWKDGTRG